MQKEANARIKINELLKEAGWRFFDEGALKANIVLENHIKLSQTQINEYGNDFEKTKSGFIDFLLIDERSHPLIVLEAKSEKHDPLFGKEQARTYAKAQNCRFIILSNGNLHYFWDTLQGNPYIITSFPSPLSMESYVNYQPNPQALVNEIICSGYIASSQRSDYDLDPDFHDPLLRDDYLKKYGLSLLRNYQVQAVESIQNAVRKKQNRFLFEMATGTGKTLVSAAIIKLFLRTGNAHRVLFLVDRLELENQAYKNMVKYLSNDYTAMIYKDNRTDWHKAQILISTVQSLIIADKYKELFSPTDFDLVISDEAHRSIGGNARAVFEYFVGYKLGLTATPKDYLKNRDPEAHSPRDIERRLLMDTYETFGCKSGEPTFRYSLVDGVRDGYLVNPIVVDARTDVSTKLLSDEGFEYIVKDQEHDFDTVYFRERDYEKRFFSHRTNITICKVFLENALRDPISSEIGKSIIFAVSQKHAAKITQILNKMADEMYPDKYNSDFAIQVTSLVPDAQQMTINFSNNNLSGRGNFIEDYRSSKTRVCVTVGMMTTGYDCTDLLNICLMRPIFSPSEFVQIKGRGTRRHNFSQEIIDPALKARHLDKVKEHYMIFDFFAVCEYFEEKYDYDRVLTLPAEPSGESSAADRPQEVKIDGAEIYTPDPLKTMEQRQIPENGMRVDRMLFQRFEEQVKNDRIIQKGVQEGNWDFVEDYINGTLINRPEDYFTLDKLRKAIPLDRRVSLREIVEKIFGFIPGFKSKEELLEGEFKKFITIMRPTGNDNIPALKYYFKAYITDKDLQNIIDDKSYAKLNTYPKFGMQDLRAVAADWRESIPEYIKDYVNINTYR
ncbi:MAG: DEAD/DEAH box helicase family protein [Candidatus Cloacimonetes bacterium]|nr:DEAD/DEAH box helicase family protein [Candidatus Cloacimonadota bacterium]